MFLITVLTVALTASLWHPHNDADETFFACFIVSVKANLT